MRSTSTAVIWFERPWKICFRPSWPTLPKSEAFPSVKKNDRGRMKESCLVFASALIHLRTYGHNISHLLSPSLSYFGKVLRQHFCLLHPPQHSLSCMPQQWNTALNANQPLPPCLQDPAHSQVHTHTHTDKVNLLWWVSRKNLVPHSPPVCLKSNHTHNQIQNYFTIVVHFTTNCCFQLIMTNKIKN